MKKMAMAVLAVFALGGVTEAVAQNASVTIPEVLILRSVSDLVIAGTAFDFSASDQATGTGSVTVETRSNITHAVSVSGADLMKNGDALTLEVQATDNSWQTLNATPVKAIGGLVAGTRSGTVNFSATADVELHAPGEYIGTITYTVIADS